MSAAGNPEDTLATVRPDRLPRRAPTAPQEPPGAAAPSAVELPMVAIEAPTALGSFGGSSSGAELALTAVLGEGGMGRVLRGTQRSLDREVAVKVLHADVHARDELVREARIVGRVEHPNVVPVHLLARSPGGEPLLVMKRIEGVRWLDLVRDRGHAHWPHLTTGTADEEQLEAHLEIFEAVCNAVAGAHERGVVHRDVKLENVMIGRFGEIYLTDWGIALDRRGALVRDDAPFAGTPSYAAPEMMSGDEHAIDERTDVYLLGATLHHAITGKPRHQGPTIYAVLGDAAESAPPTYDASVSRELAAILARAMHRDPSARFASVVALRDAIRTFRKHRHSHELVARAAGHVETLEAALADRRLDGLDRTILSALVALEEAERAWPDAPMVRPTRIAILGVVLRIEVARGSLARARELLAELRLLGAPAEDLAALVSELEREAATKDAGARELARIHGDLDLGVGQAVRRRMFATMAAIILPFGVLAVSVQLWRGEVGTPSAIFAIAATGFTAFVAFVTLHRKTLLANRVNRDIIATMGTGMGFVVLHRAIALRLGLDVRQTLALDLAGVGAVLALSSALAFPRLWPAAAVMAAAALVSLASPDHVPYAFAIAVPTFVLVAHRAFARSGRAR